MSYKFSALMLCDGNLEAFERSLSSLNNMHGYLKETQLFVFFKNFKYKYQVPIQILKAIKEQGNENIILIFEKDEKSSMEQLLEEIEHNDSRFLFFIREGDELDEYYLTYVESFFVINKDKCGVVSVPIVDNSLQTSHSDQNTLPQTGVIPFDEDSDLLLSSFGVSILTSALANITLPCILSEEHCLEIVIKSILQKGCYGRINAVTYISNSHINKWEAGILVSLAEFAEKTLNYVPKSILAYIIEEITKLLSAPCTCEEELNQNKNTMESLLAFVTDDYFESSYIWSDSRVNEFLKLKLYSYKHKNENEETFNLNDVEVSIFNAENCYENVKINGFLDLPKGLDDIELYLYQKKSDDDIVESYNINLKHEITGDTLSLAEEIISKMNFDIDINLKMESAEIYFCLKSSGVSQDFAKVKVIGEENYVEGKTIINNYYLSYSNDNRSLLRIEKITPRANYLVSCIMPIYNVEMYLREAIDSVIGQTIGFEENIQLIMINDGSPDNSRDICLEYKDKYPENVFFIDQENSGVSVARNRGLDVALGEYISFLDPDDVLQDEYMKKGVFFLREHNFEIDLVSYPLQFFGSFTGDKNHGLNYKFKETKVIDIDKDYTFIQCSSCSTIIKRESFKNLRFDEALANAEDVMLVNEIILKKMKYGAISNVFYLYRIRETGDSAIQTCKLKPDWYDKTSSVYLPLIKISEERLGYVPRYIQFLVMRDLQFYRTQKLPKEVDGLIDIETIFSDVKELIKYIDDDIIRTPQHLGYWHKMFFLKLKYDNFELTKNDTNALMVSINNQDIEPFSPLLVCSIIEEKNNLIHLVGRYNMYMEVDFNLVAVYNDKIYESVLSYSPNHDTWFLGEQIYKAIVFDFYIPFSESGDVEFYMQSCNGLRFPARIFLENQCRLTEKKHAFVVGENVIISKHSNNNKLKVDSLSINKLAIFLKDYIDSNFKDKKYVNEISVINDYYNLYSIFAKKRIWIFIDKSSRADDNAEHLYKYCCNIDDGIEKYFVLSKDSVDVERFNSIGNVIYFGSHEHKLLMLFAERFISSYADDLFNNPFRVNNDIYSLYKGLCKYDFVFLQHGIIKDNLSHGHNRILRNHKIFVTSTKLEYDSIFENNYGYSDKVVKLTGLPRYDNLYDNKEKKIVIMPTWRENLFIEKEKYNIDFANSDFCKHICDLLCDERLVDEAMKLDYEILFMPHPMTLNQIDDFKMNSYIQLIDSNISYQQIFSMGALIVTDYSSAVFDFAYLKKPVLYFQFDEGNYEKGYFDYETMGFGEVAREKEQLVDLLVEYMKNDCEMKQEYIERVGQCFAYSDRNNCKRVYGEILKI